MLDLQIIFLKTQNNLWSNNFVMKSRKMFEIDVKSFPAELKLLFETYTNWAFFLKSSVILQSIWSSKIPPTPTDNPLSICTFENFTPWNTSMLKKKSLFCWKDLTVLIQIPHPIQARFKLPNPPKAEKKPFWPVKAQ